jgi:5-methylcytosine-specific restriction endonuclease McrA
MNYLENKYSKIYFALIEKRQKNLLHFGEVHHIIPKSFGGPNTSENLVILSLREHYIAHLLLIKMFTKKTPEYKKWLEYGLLPYLDLDSVVMR